MLGNFNGLSIGYPDKIELAKALKQQGYEYFIVDFNAATIDRTPEGTLKEKVKKLQSFIRNNNALQLIGTDNIVLNGKGERVYSIYGRKLIQSGTFAAFRIK